MSQITKNALAASLKKLLAEKPLDKITVTDIAEDCGVNRQTHFKAQPGDQLVVWVYGLFTDVPGGYVKKPMRECAGMEITQEWLCHRGVPEVFGSCYDVRVLLDSTSKMMDGKKLSELKLPLAVELLEKKALKKAPGTIVEELLQRYHLI